MKKGMQYCCLCIRGCREGEDISGGHQRSPLATPAVTSSTTARMTSEELKLSICTSICSLVSLDFGHCE